MTCSQLVERSNGECYDAYVTSKCCASCRDVSCNNFKNIDVYDNYFNKADVKSNDLEKTFVLGNAWENTEFSCNAFDIASQAVIFYRLRFAFFTHISRENHTVSKYVR